MGSEQRLRIDEFLKCLWRRKGVITLATVGGTLCAFAVLVTMRPTYTAESLIEIRADKMRTTNIETVAPSIVANEFSLRTEAEKLQSSTLLSQMVEELQLAKDPEFNPSLQSLDKDWLAEIPLVSDAVTTASALWKKIADSSWVRWHGPAPDAQSVAIEKEKILKEEIVKNILRKLDVSVRERSYLISVKFSSADAAKAAAIVNEIVALYASQNQKEKELLARRATEWLKDRLAVLRSDLIAAQDAVAQYREKKGLVEVDDGARGVVTVTTQELSELNQQLVQVRLRRADIEARLERLRAASRSPGSIETIEEVLASPLIQTLRQHEAKVRRDLAEMANAYGEKHPRLIKMRAELSDIQNNIQDEVNKIAKQMEGSAAVVQRQEAMLLSQLNALKKRSLTEESDGHRLAQLQREEDTSKQIYLSFLARMKETLQQQTLQEGDIQIVSSAAIPPSPSFPKKSILLPLAFVFSASVGVLLTLALDLLERGFRDPQQIVQSAGTRVLGLVPRLPRGRRQQPLASFEMAIRDLLTGMTLFGNKPAKPLLVVTSSVPMEGKTMLALAIAKRVARSGRTCALVDADLRRPRVHDDLGVDPTPGLSDLASGSTPMSSVIRKDPESGVTYVAAGSYTDQPMETLEAEAMEKLLAELRATHDFVIIDTPPVMIVSDALLLTKVADDVLYVVEWAKTNRNTVMEGLDLVRSACGCSPLVILNQIDEQRYASMDFPDSARYSKSYAQHYRRSRQALEEFA